MTIEMALAIGDYDRIRPLKDGSVPISGVELDISHVHPADLFPLIANEEKFELTEMSLASFTIWTSAGDCPYVGIPVFPSRYFRHSFIYVNSQAGIDEPSGLRGKRVGVVPEYQITAATMVRGMLQDEYDVCPEELTWFTEREEKLPLHLPDDLEKQTISTDEDLEQMLVTGQLDAMIYPRIPRGLGSTVTRLFSDVKQRELSYYKRTGIHPIMHTLVLHEQVYNRHPEVVRTIYDAFIKAKEIAVARLYNGSTLPVTLPGLIHYVEEARETLGQDYWPYGFVENRPTLDALTRHSYEQGLTEREVDPEELFVDELLDTSLPT